MLGKSRFLNKVAAIAIVASLGFATAAQAQTSSTLSRLLALTDAAQGVRSFDTSERPAKRYALVIGNSEYQSIPELKNARADAMVTAEFLETQGYDVRLHLDITKRGFEDAMRRILFNVDKDTEVAVFFAGHGFQIGAENYLVPIDADLDTIYDVPFEAVSLGSVVSLVGSRARLQVVMLDSCRDNPFAGKEVLTQIGKELRETRTGFASQSAPLNSMLIYSTSPGTVAYDGEGANSPFTAAMIEEASQAPDALIKDVFEEVRRSVYERTNGRQLPWDSSTLVEPASFGIGAALLKPLSVDGRGGGTSRGLSRITNAPKSQSPNIQLAAERVAVIEADFLPLVDIGFTLRNALDLTPADQVTVSKGPETGRLVLTDENGFQRNVEGDTLTSAEIDALVLINESVQIPALSLDAGVIADSIEVQVNGKAASIALELAPDQCDFEAGAHLDPDGMGLTRYPNEIQPEIALAACEASIAREPENGRFHYQLGRALTALQRHDEAKVSYERARDLGHVRAWHALGMAELTEAQRTQGVSGLPKADDAILAQLARAADAGDPYALFALGRQLMEYGGTPAIELEGYDLVLRSLEVGHTFAMNALGDFYLEKDSEYYDPERGLRYLRESAARDDIYGLHNMGVVYARGLGETEVDEAQAITLFEAAIDGGHPTSPNELAWMYLDGLVTGKEDKINAVRLFNIGLERGHGNAGRYASQLIYDEGVEGYDKFDAVVFAAKTAALGDERAAEKARDLLKSYSRQALGGGAQKLINELGGEVVVDGAFGPASRAAMEAVLATYDETLDSNDPVERVVQMAAIVWRNSPFRVDLY